MFSNSLKYAIKALSFMVKIGEDKKIGLKEISESIDVPSAYIGKVLQKLVKNKFMDSLKGPKGGFYLTENNLNKSVEEVVYLFDGKDTYSNCVLNFESCNIENPCPLHDLYSPFKTQFVLNIKNKKIKDL